MKLTRSGYVDVAEQMGIEDWNTDEPQRLAIKCFMKFGLDKPENVHFWLDTPSDETVALITDASKPKKQRTQYNQTVVDEMREASRCYYFHVFDFHESFSPFSS